jgi:predicted nucleic acid-binding protein
MKKLKVYIDTSVLGAIHDRDDPIRLRTTKQFLKEIEDKRHEGFISNIGLEELDKAPEQLRTGILNIIKNVTPEMLMETDDCEELVKEYLANGIIPLKYRDDARHIAVATVYEVDAIVSWNFKHMVNVFIKRAVNSVNLRLGYKTIDILSPQEVISYGEMGD